MIGYQNREVIGFSEAANHAFLGKQKQSITVNIHSVV